MQWEATSRILVSLNRLNLSKHPNLLVMNPPSENSSLYNPRAHPYHHQPPAHIQHPGYVTYYAYPPPQHSVLPQSYTPQVTNPLTTQFHFRNTFASEPHETPFRPPLAPRTTLQSSVNTSTSSTIPQKRQSDVNSHGRLASKRPRHSDVENQPISMPSTPASASTQAPPITATGPFVAPVGASSHNHPAFTAFTSILPKEKKDSKIASDVWFCVKRVNQKQKPHVTTNPPEEELFFMRTGNCELCKLPF